MRLPWQQLTTEVKEVTAPELAANLYPPVPPDLEEALERVCKHFGTTPEELPEALAGWGLVKAFGWALARCPEHQPPSANAVVKGPTAARQIARAAGYGLNPAHYVKTAAETAFPTLEIVTEGVRFRGLDRYDAAWGSSHKEAWKAWKAEHPDRYPQEFQRNTQGSPQEFRPPDADADADRDQKLDPPPQPPPVGSGGKNRKLHPDDLRPAARARWDQIQRGRLNLRLLRETYAPGSFQRWSDELDAEGVDAIRLEHALALYLSDPDFKPKLWPTAVFITPGVFRTRLPEAPDSPHPQEASA